MSSPQISLHPLLILTISDSHARIELGSSLLPPSTPSYGLIFGTSTSTIDCIDGQECVTVKGEIDVEKAKVQSDLMKAVFPDREVVGWFKSGEEVVKEDFIQHSKISSLFSTNLFLLYSPLTSLLTPLQFSPSTKTFTPLPFTLTTTRPEKVALESVERLQVVDESLRLKGVNDLILGLEGMGERVEILREYLKGGRTELKDDIMGVLQSFQTHLKEEKEEEGVEDLVAGLVDGVGGFEGLGEKLMEGGEGKGMF
ncbi:hypothetical protein TrVE_jg3771 [Triparma verrucosa]|uniref:JAB1/MPN/MOV34 metalloenzyme domain-containing protein n=1 Tax=Triparma verrucosa TaxID=1606542 RepID=A0A9W7FMG0_9STRA|nr:hypothetical protein TrVE_jg3771 [Triparma verrucosa]